MDLTQWYEALYVAARLAWQSIRIVISLVQVVSQLGNVLQFEYPVALHTLFGQFHVIMGDLVAPLRLECYGVELGFYRIWLLQTVVVPVVALLLVLTMSWALRRCLGKRVPWSELLASEGFLVLFIAYPHVCRHAFQMIGCRKLSPSHSVLMVDYGVQCEQPTHTLYALVAKAILVGFGLCVPLALLAGMLGIFRGFRLPSCCQFRAEVVPTAGTASGSGVEPNPLHEPSAGALQESLEVHHNSNETEEAHVSEKLTKEKRELLVRFIAEDLHCTEIIADDAIRDITENQKYALVMAGFRARYFWWETIDMIRKLSILSVAAMFGHGTVRQAYCTAFLVFLWVTAQATYRPYTFFEDNWLK